MANAPFLSRAQALFGTRLLHHERHKLLEGQCRTVESFERERFEQLGALDDEPCTRFGRQMQGDPLTGQGPVTVGEEITLPTSVSEPCMKVSLHTAPLCMVI